MISAQFFTLYHKEEVMEFKFTTEYIYKSCSERISKRIEDKNISHRSIYKDESKIIGRIRRGEISDRNKYLIQDKVLEAINEKLEFNKKQAVLWGTDEEIKENLIIIFQCLLFDLISIDSPFKDTVNDILCCYTPYARYLGYYKIIFETKSPINGIEMSDLYNVDSYSAINTIESIADEAINYLFAQCHIDFEDLFLKFTKNHDSFSKWTYRLEDWVKEDLMPMLSQYKPSENGLGRRILMLIASDYKYIPNIKTHISTIEVEKYKRLISATERYITELEEISLSTKTK